MKETITKINKTESQFFKKTNKIDRPLAIRETHQGEKKKTQVNKIRKEKEITTENTEIQTLIRDYYRQQYANKVDNLKEMNKFLEKYNPPKQNQEEIENMNRQITSTEIKTVIKKK